MNVGKARMILAAGTMILSLTAGAAAAGAAQISVGGGVGLAPDYEGSQDYEPVVVPYASARWSNNLSFNLLGGKAKVNLVPSTMWRAGLVAEYIPKRGDVDNDAVAKMQDVDTSIMVGGFVGFDYGELGASVEAMQDVADGSDGAVVRINGSYRLVFVKELDFVFGVFTTWADDNYADAYFGVTAADAMRSGLRMYSADAGFKDLGASVTATYKMSDAWGLKALGAYKKLVGDAADSPVVDVEGSTSQYAVSILAYYAF